MTKNENVQRRTAEYPQMQAARGIRPKKLDPETAAKGAFTKYYVKDLRLYRVQRVDRFDGSAKERH